MLESLLDFARDSIPTAGRMEPRSMEFECPVDCDDGQIDDRGSDHPGDKVDEAEGAMDIEETAPRIAAEPPPRAYRTRSRSKLLAKQGEDAEISMHIEETA